MLRPPDPLTLPGTDESLAETLARSSALPGTPGQIYVEGRGIPVRTADAAGVRYAADFAGRAAVVVPLYGRGQSLVSLHARYLNVLRAQDKMLTIGPGGGVITVLEGWNADPLIVVEGLFDALSLAVCGYASVATIGRWVPWLAEAASGRAIWMAFDAGRSGDAQAALYTPHMVNSEIKRMPPPGRSKDWNTALVKRGAATVARWLQQHTQNAPR